MKVITVYPCLLFISLAPVETRAQTASIASRVDSVSNAVLGSSGVPSATVAVVRGGQIAYANAYGASKLDPHTTASPALRYAVGSISKQFTAVSALILQQEGKLKLDDPI